MLCITCMFMLYFCLVPFFFLLCNPLNIHFCPNYKKKKCGQDKVVEVILKPSSLVCCAIFAPDCKMHSMPRTIRTVTSSNSSRHVIFSRNHGDDLGCEKHCELNSVAHEMLDDLSII